MMYFVRITRSSVKATRLGDGSSSENTVSAGEERMPAPKMRSPAGVRIRPNSTVYQ